MTEKERGDKEDNPILKEVKRGDEYFEKGKVEEGISVYSSIARKLKKEGKVKEAMQLYSRGGDILAHLKKYDDAAKMYEQAGAFAKAAELYESVALISEKDDDRIKYAKKAGEVYEHLRKRSILIAEGKIRAQKSNLEEAVKEGASMAAGIFGVLGFLVVLFSLTGELTGFVVANESGKIASYGVLIFVLAMISMYIHIRMKKS